MSKIIEVETLFPEYVSEQKDIMGLLASVWPHHRGVLERLTETSGVERRHTLLPIESYLRLGGMEERNKVFLQTMPRLLASAVMRLQERTGFDWGDLAVISSTTVTGVAVPSLDARLMNLLPLPKNIVRNPLFGLGCLGGVAGLNRTSDLLSSRPEKLALLVAAEACSLAFQFDHMAMASMVAYSLFGDGAAAVLLAGAHHPLAKNGRLKITDYKASFYPDTERTMGWDVVDTGLKVVLSGNVPEIVEAHLKEDVTGLLQKNGLGLQDIRTVISHPGGPKVLRAVARALEKDESILSHSWKALREHGNLSSVSVLNVLQRTLRSGDLKNGPALTLAMGPGFNAEMGLLQVED